MSIFKRIRELEKAVSELSTKVSINRARINSFNWLYNVTVRFVNKSPHPNPTFAKEGDSGFDLRAWIEYQEDGVRTNDEGKNYILLFPHERRLFHTGLYMEVPAHCEVQVRPRSGLSLKQGLSVCNTPGTVDESYRGEVCVIALNTSNETVTVTDGDRIAQCVVCPVLNSYYVNFEEIGEVDTNTDRGEGGFGHTGTN